MVCISSKGPDIIGLWHHLSRPLSPLGGPKLISGLHLRGIRLACGVSRTGGLGKSITTTTRGCRADGFGRAVPTVVVSRQLSCGLAVRAVVDDRIILTVKRVAVVIMKAQCLVVLVFERARIYTSVGWCGSASYHRSRERSADQEGEDRCRQRPAVSVAMTREEMHEPPVERPCGDRDDERPGECGEEGPQHP